MTHRPLQPHEAVRRAAGTVAERGLAKGVPHDPSTGAVDVTVALQLACGTRRTLTTDDMSVAVTVVPRANLPAFLAAWEAVDATVDGLDEWQDAPSTSVDDVVNVLAAVADTLARRVT
jgi:hypothetical protein